MNEIQISVVVCVKTKSLFVAIWNPNGELDRLAVEHDRGLGVKDSKGRGDLLLCLLKKVRWPLNWSWLGSCCFFAGR